MPDHTDRAHRAGLEGEIWLEIVVTAEGSVDKVHVLRRLGSSLDEEAASTVRQWWFSPANSQVTPVAVLVEDAVGFSFGSADLEVRAEETDAWISRCSPLP